MKKRTKKVLIIIAAIVVLIAVTIGSFNIYFAVIGGQKQTGVAVGDVWSANDGFDTQVTQKIDMGSGEFKVLVLTDIHFKNSGTFAAWLGINYLLDWAGVAALHGLVEKTDPDFIIVLGDTVLTDRNDIETERFVGMMDGFKKPWACVFGNHDDEGRADKAKLADVLLESEYGMFRYGPENLHGVGNYVVELTRGDKTEYAMYLLDSGSSLEFDAKTEGINEKQIAWYEWNQNAFAEKYGKEPKNMAFFHIPLPQYKELKELGVFEQGKGEEPPATQNSKGDFLEPFTARGGTHMFVGHDHSNNFIASYNGVKLGYGTKSSYNCYFTSGMTGGTLLTVAADNSVKEEIILF